MSDNPVTEATVRAAAEHARLPLEADRVAAVTSLLQAWLPAANALSARMQAAELRPLMPVVFASPAPDAQEDRR